MAKRLRIELIEDLFRVSPKKKFSLESHDPSWMGTPELRALGKAELKGRALEFLERTRAELSEAQELLWASDRHAVLVVLQAMDAAGKDGTIKHVMSGINPQGCSVRSFKQPSSEELDHTFLWRYMKAAPRRGEIVVFNRSHYEDVLVTKVHPELLEASKLPDGKRGRAFWDARYDDINRFERHLARNGTLILKFFLHLSREEQRKRFLDRLDDPSKHWKFSMADLRERGYWDDYQEAFEDAISATSTSWAPWWVIPADHKFVARALVTAILTARIKSLKLEFPKVSDAQRKLLDDAKKQLLSER